MRSQDNHNSIRRWAELPGRAAGLEEIMVHLDKEARDDG